MGAIALIEVIIGLIFVILLLSIVVSLINEIIVSNLKIRSRLLKKSIARLLDDPNTDESLSEKFYSHPLINKLTKKRKSIPSYITSSIFSKVLIDILQENNETSQSLKDAINRLTENSETKIALHTLLRDAENKTTEFKLNIEEWFNDSMDRLSGWYKRYTQIQLFIIAFFAAMILNVNIIHIAKELSDDKEKRIQITEAAYALVRNNNEKLSVEHSDLKKIYEKNNEVIKFQRTNPQDSTPQMSENLIDSVNTEMHTQDSLLDIQTEKIHCYQEEIEEINDQTNQFSGLYGIFWQGKVGGIKSFFNQLSKTKFKDLIGWLIAALAASLGSAFWFDMLKRVVNIRGTVKNIKTASN